MNVFIHVYYNILYLLIVSVLWILTFEQRMVISSHWYIFISMMMYKSIICAFGATSSLTMT